ncbi:unnamed protein product [Urochloa humidicola]
MPAFAAPSQAVAAAAAVLGRGSGDVASRHRSTARPPPPPASERRGAIQALPAEGAGRKSTARACRPRLLRAGSWRPLAAGSSAR